MSTFFAGWALWEKMTFVLAFCIVIAMGLGGCRNIYTRWRLRQYTSVSIKHPTPNMVEAQTDEVPFGIKAIESGVEVEGVWISRSNTPVPSGSNSLNNSPANSARASIASSIFLNDTVPVPDSASSQSDKSRRHSLLKPSWPSTKEPQTVLERDRSTERLVPEVSRSRLPCAGSSRSRHTSMPVMSRLRESMTLSPQPDYNRESSGSLTDGDQNSQRPSSEPRPSTDPSTSLDSGGSSSRSYRRASQYTYTEPSSDNERQPLAWHRKNKGKGRMLERGADLGLLQSHRMSHVAETGQLGHRTRRTANVSNGRASLANPEPPAQRSEPEPEVELETDTEPEPELPELDLTLPTLSQVDLHFETSSSAFSAPVPRGLFETPLPPHLDSMSDYSSELDLGVIQDVIRTRYLDEPRPRCPSPGSKMERPGSWGERRSFQAERDSKILRNVNSSFQVLHPGTFAPPETATTWAGYRIELQLQRAFMEHLPSLPEDAIIIHRYLPEGVSKIIAQGSSSFIGKLNEETVLKYPCVQGEEWDRFIVEKRIYEALCPHPRIIRSYGLDKRGLILEYATRGTFQDHLRSLDSAKSITKADRIRWCQQAAEAVAYIHKKKVLHCDISTRNLLLDKDFNVKLSDFQGEYVDGNGVRHNGWALENNKFYLPRSLNHSDEQSDIFALGTSIYEIMTGHEPFPELDEHKDGEEIERRYRNKEFPGVRGIVGGSIINKCWNCLYKNAEVCTEELYEINPD
ncbi:hypothetical protein FKW77_004434 [Venturia effusa]|uniref:EKC/KEOPS complex subunit BUD32 n=1 Tax=Venturia effusa TaxID=50376 RepID=A0A517LFB1_9PEZI|nr:hypothetical protein FKW77_004434 [Venturia effusa]